MKRDCITQRLKSWLESIKWPRLKLLQKRQRTNSPPQRSIIIFWGDCESFWWRWWYLHKRYVHVSVIIAQDTGVYHLSPSCSQFIHEFKDCDESSFERLVDKLSMLRKYGATEVVLIDSDGTKSNMGGWPWYNCQSMVRDFARLELGFVVNPLHLSLKLRKGIGRNWRVVKRVEL